MPRRCNPEATEAPLAGQSSQPLVQYLGDSPPTLQLKLAGRYVRPLPLLFGALAILLILAGAFVAASFAFVHSAAGQSFTDRFGCVPTQPEVEPGYPLYTSVFLSISAPPAYRRAP